MRDKIISDGRRSFDLSDGIATPRTEPLPAELVEAVAAWPGPCIYHYRYCDQVAFAAPLEDEHPGLEDLWPKDWFWAAKHARTAVRDLKTAYMHAKDAGLAGNFENFLLHVTQSFAAPIV